MENFDPTTGEGRGAAPFTGGENRKLQRKKQKWLNMDCFRSVQTS